MNDAQRAPEQDRSSDARLAVLMAAQYSIATRRQARTCGLDRNAIARRLRRGTLVEPVPGILCAPNVPRTWEARVLAAVLLGGRGAAASHRAAAHLHRLNGFDWAPLEITVRRPHNRFGEEIVHLSRDLGPIDVVLCGPIPTTSIERTLLDLGPVIGRRMLTRVLDDARRRDLTTTARCRDRLEALRRRGRPGVAVLEAVLDAEGDQPVPESTLERMFLELCEDLNLPLPSRQVPVRRPDGTVARVDLAYPDLRIAIELDGHGSHATRAERAADSARQNDIATADWLVLRFTYEQVRNERYAVAQHVRHAIRRQLDRPDLLPARPARQK